MTSSKQEPGENPKSEKHPKDHLANIRSHATDSVAGTMKHLRARYHWDIRMPPTKKHTFRGHLVPTVKSAMALFTTKNRRLSIEIHSPDAEEPADDAQQASKMRSLLRGTEPSIADLEHQDLRDNETVFVRILKAVKSHLRGDDASTESPPRTHDDNKSLSTLGTPGGDEDVEDGDHDQTSWKEQHCYKLEELVILKRSGRIIEVQLGSGNELVVRDLRFADEKDALAFERTLQRMMDLEHERAQRQIVLYKSKAGGGCTDKSINLLVEIVAAIDLPVADLSSTDAYVICRMGGKEVHRTQVISKNLDPIWTLSNGSLFLLQMTPEEFFSCTGGLSFTIKDYDSLGSNEILGRVTVSLEELLKGKGERTEYEIQVDRKMAKAVEKQGKFVLRFKEASADDIEFMKVHEQNLNKVGVYSDETFLPPRRPDPTLLKRQTKKNEQRQVVHRVKPYPDPSREEETKWMTESKIESESVKPSTSWTEAGSGDLGRLYFEILGCDHLPNLDAMTLNLRDKTDAFACLIFEDAVVMSDVIGDSLSPRWMPWSTRSFMFNISHPSSALQLGIFDYDPENSPLQMVTQAAADLHDPVGRVRINVSMFRPNVEYTLKYNLYLGELAADRVKPRGTVTVRMRIEWNDMRKALVSGVLPPPPRYVSVAKPIHFQVAHYVTEGMHDEKKFNMNTFAEYIEELESYQSILPYIKEAALAVWLWRGHYNVKMFGKEFSLPLHSLTAFVWGILVSWDFNMFPSFLLFSIGWLFLACNEYVDDNPSPWHKCPKYHVLFRALTLNDTPTVTIEKNQNLAEIEAYNKTQEEREARLQKEREQDEQNELALREMLGEEFEEAEAQEEDITTKKTGFLEGFNVNPLKPVLYPIQLQLYQAVISLRITRSILLWEESYYAFWITTVAFVASVATIWIPWGFILRWLLRIFVVLSLGPWMAIVDRMYFRSKPGMSDADKDAEVEARLKSRYMEVLAAATDYHVRKERAVKLKDMTRYMFGNFLLRVPRFTEDLFADMPLTDSHASPYDPATAEPIHITQRKYGQVLKGDMIPQRDIQAAHVAKTKPQSAKKKRFWRRKKQTDDEKVPLLGDGSNDGNGYDAVATNTTADDKKVE